jgi:hypothetical protein
MADQAVSLAAIEGSGVGWDLAGVYLQVTFTCLACMNPGLFGRVLVNEKFLGIEGKCRNCGKVDCRWFQMVQLASFTSGDMEIVEIERQLPGGGPGAQQPRPDGAA